MTDSLQPPRRMFGRLRGPHSHLGMAKILPALQAYGGLQAFTRDRPPAQSLGRVGSLEVRLAEPAAEVRHASGIAVSRYRNESHAERGH
jgi:L-ornithine Nalpha-acyltransferase